MSMFRALLFTFVLGCGAASAQTVAPGGGTIQAATKADEQAGSSAILATTPSQQQQHDSAAKAWVDFVGSAVNGAQTINASYNVSSVSRSSAGIYLVTFTTPFATANYVCSVTPTGSASNTWGQVVSGGKSTGSINTQYLTNAAAAADPGEGMVVCYGRQ